MGTVRNNVAMTKQFENKRVVVTGAGGGLGSTLVNYLHSAGASVIGCDQNAEALAGLPLTQSFTFDLLDRAAAERVADEIIGDLPDILINNAGWTRAETLSSLTGEKIVQEVDLNLTGVMLFTDKIAKAFAERSSGSIVFVSSVNALSHFGNPAYAAAKAGINAYALSIAVEYGRRGVRSNVVCPGSIRTHAWDHRLAKDPTIMDKLKRLYPLGRIVEAREVVEAIAFLASDRASGITGVVLPVDAGLTAGYLPFIDDILGG
jgi:NAD(P)-dependent dehydrogenase (short-subunit alcohol dehydrogenase family)